MTEGSRLFSENGTIITKGLDLTGLVTHATDPVLIISDGYFIQCNAAAATIFGTSSPDEFHKIKPQDLSQE